MEIREITNREEWEGFLLLCDEKSFVNSWSWGDFQLKENNKIWRQGIFENDELLAIFMAIKIKAKRGTFLFLPHCPNIKRDIDTDKKEICDFVFTEIKKLAKIEKAAFARIAPIFERSDENNKLFFGLKKAPIHMHPEVTWELDINPSEEDILRGMRKTTRYLVRLAKKNQDIEIIKSQNREDLKLFNEVYLETVKRHNFVPFSLRYLENQFDSFIKNNEIVIFLGKYKGEVVSTAIIVFWQGVAFYHHGASLSKINNNKTPISYLLQWEAIKEAKKRGCSLYNFWGIAPEIKDKDDVKKSSHPWAGLSLFKMGFGGYRKEYVQTQDLIISPAYYLTYIFEVLRKAKRHL